MNDGGLRWIWEYNSSETLKGYRFVRQFSPIHNIPENGFPAILLLTSGSDDRVNPSHSFEYMATLQSKQTSSLALMRTVMGGHHGLRDEAEPELLFLLGVLGKNRYR